VTRRDRHLLVLDLDETLLFASEHTLQRSSDFRAGHYFVYRRPGLAGFLRKMSALFEVAVWTSSSPAYAHAVCTEVFGDLPAPAFVWAADRCTLKRHLESDSWSHAKHLSKLKRRGYELSRVLMVDDSPEKHLRNYGNLVRVSPYYGGEGDDELHWLGLYLAGLTQVMDIRTIEKREWRRRVQASTGNGNQRAPP
jgi:carboxy-terminal domain RNA polymerase II polypeptide A small phosphatase